MLRLLLSLLFAQAALDSVAQVTDVNTLMPPDGLQNVHYQQIGSTPDATVFLVWVKQQVQAHYHADHTETVIVLEGEGVMTLGEEMQMLKPGVVVVIPSGTIHEVQVTSKEPMKVLSVQAPEFDGSDRILVDE
jgi:mannose-6-phosphate isomerase-like protein (cupin superfamily)